MKRQGGKTSLSISIGPRNRLFGFGLIVMLVCSGLLTSRVWAAQPSMPAGEGLMAAPAAADDDYTTPVNTPLVVAVPGVLENDSDPEGDPMTASLVDDVTNGTLALASDGSFTYTPAADFHGMDGFTYTASDGSLTSSPAVVTITVNTAPEITGDHGVSTAEETAVTITLNDLIVTDPDNIYPDDFTLSVQDGTNYTRNGAEITPDAEFNGDLTVPVTVNDGLEDSNSYNLTLTVTPVNDVPVITGQAVTLSTAEDTGLLIVLSHVTVEDPDNTFPDDFTLAVQNGTNYTVSGNTITPVLNYHGTLTMPVTVNDGTDSSAPFDLSVTVTPVNDAPVAVADNYGATEDTLLEVAAPGVLGNDTDVEGDTLTAILTTNVSHGSLTLDSDGSFSYQPAANYNGSDSFSYKANDGELDSNIVSVSLSIAAVNDAPVITGQAVLLSTPEDTGLIIQLNHVTVSDPDNTYPDDFTLEVQNGTNYTVSGNTITPVLNYHGTLTVPVTVNDGLLDSNSYNLTVTVTPVNDAPVLDAIGNKTVDELVELEFTATATDVDVPADTLSYSLAAGTAGAVPVGAEINPNTGAFSWTPTEAQGPGSYTFDVCVSDGTVDVCETITVTVNEVNLAPVLGAIGNQTVNELVELEFIASATDADLPANTLTYSLSGAVPPGAEINSNTGAFSWTPSEAQGPGSHTFDVCVNDGTASDCETITVTVNEVNLAPVLGTVGNKMVNELVELEFIASATDADLPANTLSYTLAAGTAGEVPAEAEINPTSGAFSWTPSEAQGPGVYTFDVCVSDGTASDCETITVTVNEVNVAPVAVTDNITIAEDAGLTEIDVLFNDTDADIPPNTLSVIGVGSAAHGTVGLGPGGAYVTYTPVANYHGSDTFSYTITDGEGGTDVGTVNITVTSVNDAPVVTSIPNQTIAEGGSFATINLDLYVSDIDHLDSEITWTSSGSTDLIVSIVDRVATIDVPDADWNGQETITFRATDPGLLYDETSAVFTVTPVNDAPVGVNDHYYYSMSTRVMVDTDADEVPDTYKLIIPAPGVMENDHDVDGDTLTVSLKTGLTDTNGTLTLNADGSFEFMRNTARDEYTDSFWYTLDDGQGGLVDVKVNLTIDVVPPDVSVEWLEPDIVDENYTANDDPLDLRIRLDTTDDVYRVEFRWWNTVDPDNLHWVTVSTQLVTPGLLDYSYTLDMRTLPYLNDIQVHAFAFDEAGSFKRNWFFLIHEHSIYDVFLPLVKR